MPRKQSSNSIANRHRRPYSAVWVLIAGCALCASASAASNLPIECDETDDLRAVAASDALTVSVVDLGESIGAGLDDGIGNGDADDTLDSLTANTDESLAPQLYLGPRVASILDSVFDEESDSGLLNDNSNRQSIAPVAETRDDVAIPASDPITLGNEPAYLKIHRQMYRTDI